jgi:hypothetical protein
MGLIHKETQKNSSSQTIFCPPSHQLLPSPSPWADRLNAHGRAGCTQHSLQQAAHCSRLPKPLMVAVGVCHFIVHARELAAKVHDVVVASTVMQCPRSRQASGRHTVFLPLAVNMAWNMGDIGSGKSGWPLSLPIPHDFRGTMQLFKLHCPLPVGCGGLATRCSLQPSR